MKPTTAVDSTQNQSSTATLPRLEKAIHRRLHVCLIVAWVAVVFGFLGRFHWTFDLCSHFYVQCVVIIFVGTLACVRTYNKQLKLISLLAACGLLIPIGWLYIRPSDPNASSNHRLRFVSCNVLTSNPNKAAVLDYLRRSNADVVLLMEIDYDWADSISSLKDIYPHQFQIPSEDNFGVSLISKEPWEQADQIFLDRSRVSSVEAVFRVDGKRLRLFGTHPLPPMGSRNSMYRNAHFETLVTKIRETPDACLVLGDLNCTSWSHYFQKLLLDGKLRDSRQGYGVQPSWPAGWKLSLMGSMRITIDHALVSEQLKVLDRRVGPFVGSDHFPIEVEIGF